MLVLTYTHKAADEMRQRVEAEIGGLPAESPLTTYHAFAQRVIREWGWTVGVPPHFRIADDAERWIHADAVISALRPPTLYNPLRPHDFVDTVLTVTSEAKRELVSPDTYERWVNEQLSSCEDPALKSLLRRHGECARIYRALNDRYLAEGVLDHDDTI